MREAKRERKGVEDRGEGRERIGGGKIERERRWSEERNRDMQKQKKAIESAVFHCSNHWTDIRTRRR